MKLLDRGLIEGTIYKSKNYGKFEIIKYENSRNVWVRFLDTRFDIKTTLNRIKIGSVKDYTKPTIYGVGFLGKYVKTNTKTYRQWIAMMQRCYAQDSTRNITYKDVVVCDEWHNYSLFLEWAEKQVGFEAEGYHLDKDILQKGNRVYCPTLCGFVPQNINSLFCKADSIRGEYPIGVRKYKKRFLSTVCNGAGEQINLGSSLTVEDAFLKYKKAKEAIIRLVADFHKEVIDSKIYQALINYEVEITD